MKKILIFTLLLFFGVAVIAQTDDDESYVYGDVSGSNKEDNSSKGKFDWSRMIVGGGMGATFGDLTYVEVSPTVGYFLTDQIIVGLGGTYIYFHDKRVDYKTNIYGGNLYTQYLFEDLPILVHAETALVNYQSFLKERRINSVAVLVGGGLKQQVGDRSYLSILMLWDLNETDDSFYPNPIIRAGIAIGL